MKTMARIKISRKEGGGLAGARAEYDPKMSAAEMLNVAVAEADVLHAFLTKICKREGLDVVTEIICGIVRNGYNDEEAGEWG